MAVSVESLVFAHLKANCSDKVVARFCKEAKFSPEVKNTKTSTTIVEIFEHFNATKVEEDEESTKKRKHSESSEDSEEDEEETTVVEKKTKLDLSTIKCRKCNELGHMSRECPENNKTVDFTADQNYVGGTNQDASEVECFTCKKIGHFNRDCPDKFSDMNCYNCGKTGHLSRDCPDKAAGMQCYNCQKTGHMSRECTEAAGANSKMLCYNCQTTGHMARDCTRPTVARPNSGGGGRGGGRDRGASFPGGNLRTWGTGSNSAPLGVKKSFEEEA
jgi:cellular nucleic acid-binding protein